MRVMRWMFAAFAFAGAVGLAVMTATVGAENVQVRRRLQLLDERAVAVRIEFEKLRARGQLELGPARVRELAERLLWSEEN